MACERSQSEIENDELIAKLKEAFDAVDVDHNGSISREDLKTALHKSGYEATDKAIQSLLKAVDSDESGCINFEEFSLYYIRFRSKLELIKDIQEQFKDLDKDHSGSLTREELKTAMLNNPDLDITEEEVEEFIREADTDQDGTISLQEWLDSFVVIYD